jgi:eukaryotic-like serine/threonine-protein kinase
MDPALWQQVKTLFDLALQHEPGRRTEFVGEVCADNPILRDELLSLLASFDRSHSFIEPPSIDRPAVTDSADIPPFAGRRVGPYELLRVIAEGGMGTVYLAARADDQYQKRVAIKVIRAAVDRQEVVRRFRHERQMLAALSHPNIVTLLDGGTTEDGLPFLVMDYVEGLPVDEYCRARRLSIPERLRIFLGICGAVQHAHQNLVVHRDLKPSNVLVTVDGTPKLLDFGIAKLLRPEFSPEPIAVTRTTERPMTLEYASPEQIKGDPITTATDVYALGVVLYQMLTGASPYAVETGSPFELERAICEKQPDKPSAAISRSDPHDRTGRELAGDLDTIVLTTLHKEPRHRYVSVERLAEDIRRHLEDRPVLARGLTLRYRARKFVRRHTAAVLAGGLAVVALVGGVAATTRQTFVARAARARAERRFDDVRTLAQSMFTIHDAIQNLNGATPARRLIVSTAVEYLDRLSQEAADDASLQTELADGYLKVGDVQGYPYGANLGDLDGAFASYRKAAAIAQTAVRSRSDDVAARWVLARSQERLGAALMQRGDAMEAEKDFRRALAIYEPLSAASRGNLQLRQDLARCYDSLGDALGSPAFLSQRNTVAALEIYRRALAIDEEIGAADPSNRRARRGVGVESVKIADMLGESFDTVGALERYGAALTIFNQLADGDPSNADLRRTTEVIHGRIAENLAEIDDVDGALASSGQELAIAEALWQRDPRNALAEHDVAIALKRIGDLHARQGRTREALDDYERLLPIIERLTADPANGQWRSQLAEALISVSRLQAHAGRIDAARTSASRGLSILKAEADDAGAGPDELNTYASALLTGEPAAIRDPKTALRYAERAVEATHERNAAALDTLARAQFDIGNAARAVAIENQALALLPRSISGGPPSATRREFEASLAKYKAVGQRPH